MNKILAITAAIASVLVLNSSIGNAAEPSKKQSQVSQQSEMIYGSQLMSEKERDEFRVKMQSLKTQQERDAFRDDHHKQMQERAAAKGLMLPDNMPRNGMGQGGMGQSGMGQSGMGQGGMGQGGSRNR